MSVWTYFGIAVVYLLLGVRFCKYYLKKYKIKIDDFWQDPGPCFSIPFWPIYLFLLGPGPLLRRYLDVHKDKSGSVLQTPGLPSMGIVEIEDSASRLNIQHIAFGRSGLRVWVDGIVARDMGSGDRPFTIYGHDVTTCYEGELTIDHYHYSYDKFEAVLEIPMESPQLDGLTQAITGTTALATVLQQKITGVTP